MHIAGAVNPDGGGVVDSHSKHLAGDTGGRVYEATINGIGA